MDRRRTPNLADMPKVAPWRERLAADAMAASRATGNVVGGVVDEAKNDPVMFGASMLPFGASAVETYRHGSPEAETLAFDTAFAALPFARQIGRAALKAAPVAAAMVAAPDEAEASPLSRLRRFFSPSATIHDPRVVDQAVRGDADAVARLAREQGAAGSSTGDVLNRAINTDMSRRHFLRGAAGAAASNLIDSTALAQLAKPKFDVYPSLRTQYDNQLAMMLGPEFERALIRHGNLEDMMTEYEFPSRYLSAAERLSSSPQFKSLGLSGEDEAYEMLQHFTAPANFDVMDALEIARHPDVLSAARSNFAGSYSPFAADRVFTPKVSSLREVWDPDGWGLETDLSLLSPDELKQVHDAWKPRIAREIELQRIGDAETEAARNNYIKSLEGSPVRGTYTTVSPEGEITVNPDHFAPSPTFRARQQRFAKGGLARFADGGQVNWIGMGSDPYSQSSPAPSPSTPTNAQGLPDFSSSISLPSLGISNPTLGMGLGTLASAATGIPGLGFAGTALGTLGDLANANTALSVSNANNPNMNAPALGAKDFFSGLVNNASFGMLGTSIGDSMIGNAISGVSQPGVPGNAANDPDSFSSAQAGGGTGGAGVGDPGGPAGGFGGGYGGDSPDSGNGDPSGGREAKGGYIKDSPKRRRNGLAAVMEHYNGR